MHRPLYAQERTCEPKLQPEFLLLTAALEVNQRLLNLLTGFRQANVLLLPCVKTELSAQMCYFT
jgi:hypothetical protein